MKAFSANFWLLIFSALFVVSGSYGLLDAWRHSPLEKNIWILFVLWLAVPIYHAVKSSSLNSSWLIAAILLGGMGRVMEMNFLNYFALALFLVSWVKPWKMAFLAFLTSVSWMPLFGWVFKNEPSLWVNFSRALIALLPLIIFLIIRTRHSKGEA